MSTLVENSEAAEVSTPHPGTLAASDATASANPAADQERPTADQEEPATDQEEPAAAPTIPPPQLKPAEGQTHRGRSSGPIFRIRTEEDRRKWRARTEELVRQGRDRHAAQGVALKQLDNELIAQLACSSAGE